jgi:hypothetical protein
MAATWSVSGSSGKRACLRQVSTTGNFRMTDMRNLPVGQINDLANAFSLASSRGGRSTAVSRDGEASWFETHGDNRALTNEGQTLPANQIYSAAICRGAGGGLARSAASWA